MVLKEFFIIGQEKYKFEYFYITMSFTVIKIWSDVYVVYIFMCEKNVIKTRFHISCKLVYFIIFFNVFYQTTRTNTCNYP